MTKEDYMKLSKERLAELLEERDIEDKKKEVHVIPISTPDYVPCYAPNGICTNPQRDCVNCPKLSSTGGTWTTNTNINTKD